MLVYAGIDEAGYGPMLGPLCVACAAFVVDDHDPAAGAPDLWKRLDDAVCREKRDPRKRIAIDDSKKLKGANSSKTIHPLRHLERGVLALLMQDADPIADDGALLRRLGAAAADEPWYASTTPLPVAESAEQLRIDAARLKRAMTAAAVRCELLACEAIDAAPFNHAVRRMGRKSAVNLGAAMRHAETIWQRWPDDHPRVIIDRQGGRTHYLRELQLAFAGAHVRIIAESEAVSRYELARGGTVDEGGTRQGGSKLTVTFLPRADGRHLPVALASMIAKYTRELLMGRLNRFFSAHLPELKPTAGYVTDARRYLRDIGDLLGELGVERHRLVRVV
jgi:ribonuclease HII